MQGNNSIILVVDEGAQGYTKEFGSADAILEALAPLIDEQVTEVRVKRKGPANSSSPSTKD